MSDLVDGAAEHLTLERGLLGGLLWSQRAPLPRVRAEHFRLGAHREVWALFEQFALTNTPREAPLVVHGLCRAGWPHVDAAAWVARAMDEGIHCVDFGHYAAILRRAAA